MQKFILVATPQPPFGELLRLSLEELGSYQVYQVQTGDQALANANRMKFNLAILDAELSGLPLPSLVQALRYFHPEIRLIVIPPENNSEHPSLAELNADGYLNRPFYIPDMIETVEKILATVNPQPTERISHNQTAGLSGEQQETSPLTLPWLNDADLVTQRLTGLMQESPAHATLIARNGNLWARAGHLDKTASQEIVTLLDRYWDESEKSDLARFIRLNSNKNEYLLYATGLADDLVLASVYDPYTPITRIRSQIGLVARALAVPPTPTPDDPAALQKTVTPTRQVIPESLPAVSLAVAEMEPAQAQVQAAVPQMIMPEPSVSVQSPAPILESLQPEPPKSVQSPAPVLESLQPEPPVSVQSPAPILESSPPESPISVQSPAPVLESLQPEPPVSVQSPAPILESSPPEPPKPPTAQGASLFEVLSRPDETTMEDLTGEEDNTPLDEASQISLAEMLASMPSPDPEVNRRTILPDWAAEGGKPAFNPTPTAFAASNPAERVETSTEEKIKIPNNMPVFSDVPSDLARFEGADLDQVQTDSLADTRPMLLGPATQLSDMEPVSAAYSRLSYTCLLVPRMPYHYLTGELADRLNQWLTHCCLAFGWRLEGLAIRPEYMQWIVQVSPAISPGNLVRIVRQRTSQYIFSHYPQINYENPSGDFWAPGYLILSGSQLPSSQMLREFIIQTRQRQGIKRS